MNTKHAPMHLLDICISSLKSTIRFTYQLSPSFFSLEITNLCHLVAGLHKDDCSWAEEAGVDRHCHISHPNAQRCASLGSDGVEVVEDCQCAVVGLRNLEVEDIGGAAVGLQGHTNHGVEYRRKVVAEDAHRMVAVERLWVCHMRVGCRTAAAAAAAHGMGRKMMHLMVGMSLEVPFQNNLPGESCSSSSRNYCLPTRR